MSKNHKTAGAAAVLFLLTAGPAVAQIPIPASGDVYQQNFDTLPSSGTFTWANNATLPGWFAADLAGTFNATGAVSAGTSNLADQTLASLGAAASAERALAYHTRLDDKPTHLGLAFVNNTGQPLTSFSLAYSAEQWREAANGRTVSVAVEYRVGAVPGNLPATTGWTAIPGLGFTTTNPASVPTATTLAATDLPVDVPAGSSLWLRWKFTNSYENSTSAHDLLAIDNVVFSTSGSSAVAAPVITTHPVSQNVTAGSPVTFTAAASGRPAPTFRWFKGDVEIPGATSATLTIGSATPADSGDYHVVATNSVDSDTSRIATLTVSSAPPAAPQITTQPVSRTVSAGQGVTFTVVAGGTSPLSYQWFKGAAAIPGATSDSLTISPVAAADAGSYRVTVTNALATVTSNTAVLSVAAAQQFSKYDLTGFATLGGGTTGGGEIPETDPAYRKCGTPLEFVTAVRDANKTAGAVKVIEITADLNLGWNEIGDAAKALTSNPIRAHAVPKLHPTLIASGVSVIDIVPKSGLTIFSSNGATIKHVTLNLKSSSNIVIRNLRFDEMWEWDEATKGDYDSNDWDFLVLSNGGTVSNVWIDHCTFTKSYDGIADMKKGTQFVTLSWCRYVGDDGATNPDSHVRRQIAALEADKSSHPFYNFLRTKGFSQEDVVQIVQGHDKGHLMGATEKDAQNAVLSATFHHQWFQNLWDRCVPRLRGGQVHNYNILVDDSTALVARRLRDTRAAAMTSADRNTLNSTYNFLPFLNGSISTEGGAILVEKSIYKDCVSPLRNNQTDVTDPTYTGKIKSVDTIYTFHNTSGTTTTVRGDSTDPGNPMGPSQAPVIPFSWNTPDGSAPYTLPAAAYDDPDALPAVLAAGAGAGTLTWDKSNWLKVSYADTTLPSIDVQPVARTVTPASEVSFSVTASGTAPLTYQWRRSGIPITGATAATYRIPSAQAADSGSYDVVVTANGSSIASDPAALAVLDNFQAWATRNGISSATGDSDNDGIPDLAEFALGLDPKQPSTAGSPVLTDEGERIVFRFTRPNHLTGISYTVRLSTDLVDWNRTVEAVVESSTASTETLVATVPRETPGLYARLQIRTQP